MIIEFTGIPGSGKSTILKRLEGDLSNEKYVFNIKRYIIGFDAPTVVYDLYLLFFCFRLSKHDIEFLSEIVNIVLKSKNSFFHKVNIIRNSYKKIVINKILQNKDKVFFIDEGISHIPFTLFVDVNKEIDTYEIERFINSVEYNNELFIIDAEDQVLTDRVIKRGKEGHRRIDFTQEQLVKKFMQQSRIVLNEIKKNCKYKEYNNIGKIDIMKIKQLLGVK